MESGAHDRIRTCILSLRRRLLLQSSYVGDVVLSIGFKPTTFAFARQRSVQLSYESIRNIVRYELYVSITMLQCDPDRTRTGSLSVDSGVLWPLSYGT